MIKALFLGLLIAFSTQSGVWADEAKESTGKITKAMARSMVYGSIRKYEIVEDVTVEDAIESMQLRANMLNFKMVADLPLSEQVESMGEKANYMRILAFCDAVIAAKLVDYDPVFAGFLPCRIAVVQDEKGKGWIVTMNMDLMVTTIDLPPKLKPLAEKVRDNINSIVDAGVNGDL